MEKVKKKKRHIALWIFWAVLAIMLFIFIVCAIRWAVHRTSPEEGYGEYEFAGGTIEFDLDLFPSLVIDENATSLKILQLTDPQIKFGAFPSRDRKTFDLLEKAIKTEKPDLCVVTGDLTLSVFTYDAYKYFADFMQRIGVKWTLVYGNHDAQFDCSKYTLYNLLKGYDNCLFQAGPSDIYGECNFLINVFKGQKKADNLAYSLVMLDSGMYPEEGNTSLTDWVYDWIHQSQMDWYEWAIKGLQSINPEVQSSMFFHIPLKEFADMYYLNEIDRGNEVPAAVADSFVNRGIDTTYISDVKGVVRESDKDASECVYGDDGYTVGIYYQGNAEGVTDHPDVFKYVKDFGSTKGIFCGHDHVNNLKGYFDGIYLGYGLCCGYHTYPFFDNANFITNMFGLSDKVLYNGALWLDENGNRMEKGVTVIEVDLTANYGALTVTDKGESVLGE
ncbi:MAG: metallophosphoesterase [Corallococcus sp.]|nr:metallophosphoesterase [Corallococcus sp.]MCM1359500.1 metallophosphoesterase [Corallococcus sp.]MCM1394688.1 metallophosphoesterase [Corallococcus sp.]